MSANSRSSRVAGSSARGHDLAVLRINLLVERPATKQCVRMGEHRSHLSSEERAVLQMEVSNGAGIRSLRDASVRVASNATPEQETSGSTQFSIAAKAHFPPGT